MTFLKSYLAAFEEKMCSESGYVPELYDLIIIDALIASFQISLDRKISNINLCSTICIWDETRGAGLDDIIGNFMTFIWGCGALFRN